MHLSDEQLLEVDESVQAHINECDSCSQRLNNLLIFRKSFKKTSLNEAQLKEVTIKKITTNGWNEILVLQKERQRLLLKNENIKRINKWKLPTFALVASLMILTFWQVNQQSMLYANNKQLVKLIKHNNYLQQQLDDFKHQEYKTNANYILLQLDVQNIDQRIQRAYLQGVNNKFKSDLWEKRKQIINHLLSETKTTQTLSI